MTVDDLISLEFEPPSLSLISFGTLIYTITFIVKGNIEQSRSLSFANKLEGTGIDAQGFDVQKIETNKQIYFYGSGIQSYYITEKNRPNFLTATHIGLKW